MAPEVIHSHVGYSFKADIWSFGITAMELAYGRPPLSHLPPSTSLLVKITKRFRFSDFDKHDEANKNKKFSKAFKEMVASCLDPDPSKRPTAEKLLKHPFFKNCKGADFLVRNLLQGLPSVEERFRDSKSASQGSSGNKNYQEEEEDEEEENVIKTRRISGWNFNEEGFKLDPVFPSESTRDDDDGDGDSLVKQVRFGGETIIPDDKANPPVVEPGESGGSGESEGSRPTSIDRVEEMDRLVEQGGSSGSNPVSTNPSDEVRQVDGSSLSHSAEPSSSDGADESSSESVSQVMEAGQTAGSNPGQEIEAAEFGGSVRSNPSLLSEGAGGEDRTNTNAGGLDKEVIVRELTFLKKSLDEQKRQVVELIGQFGGEVTTEDQLPQILQGLKLELETERIKNQQLEMELNFFKDLISGAYSRPSDFK